MTLTYTQTTHRTVTETKTRTLLVPRHWGMFTKAGNRRLQTIAQRAFDELVALKAKDETCCPAASKVRHILVKFLAAWERMGYTKSYGEAGDTVVRHCVADFHDKLRATSGQDVWNASDEWEQNWAEAYSLVIKARKAQGKQPASSINC